jgi:hypothetical protein
MPTGNMDVKPNRLIERVMAGYMGVVTKTCGLMPVEWPIAGKLDRCGIANTCCGHRLF